MPERQHNRILVLSGGSARHQVLSAAKIVRKHTDAVAGLIIAAGADLQLAAETQEVLGPEIPVFHSRRPWDDPEIMAFIAKSSDIAVNIGFSFIIDERLLAAIPVVNMHPSALPLNRGCHHSFWGIIKGTPHGATLHWMDGGLDTGDIIDQETFADDGLMPAEVVFDRAHSLCLELLDRNLTQIIAGTARRTPQDEGTYHSRKEIEKASTLSADDHIKVEDLLRLCRATSVLDHGFFILKDGKKLKVTARVVDVTDDEQE